MKHEIKQQIRITIIGILGWCAILCAVSEPASQDDWFMVFLASKAIAVLFGYAAYILWRYWDAKGLLPEMDDDEV